MNKIRRVWQAAIKGAYHEFLGDYSSKDDDEPSGYSFNLVVWHEEDQIAELDDNLTVGELRAIMVIIQLYQRIKEAFS